MSFPPHPPSFSQQRRLKRKSRNILTLTYFLVAVGVLLVSAMWLLALLSDTAGAERSRVRTYVKTT